MNTVQKNEIDINYCLECKGVWLDRGGIDKIASIQNKYEDIITRNITMDEEIMIMIMIMITMTTITDAEERGDSLKTYFILAS